MKKKAVSLMLCLAMGLSTLGGAVVCSAAEETEITIWYQDVPVGGVQNNAVADKIAEETGVRVNFVKGDAEKFQVLMAGDDLPDIVYFNNSYGITPKTLIETGQIIPLDELVAEYGDNISSNSPEKLDYSRQFISDTDELYYIPMNCLSGGDDKVANYFGASISFLGRWDLYAQAGYPEVTNEDEYLALLKQMQDENPTTSDGRNVYAIGAWSDWGIWPYWVIYTWTHGYEDTANFTITNKVTGEMENRFYSEQFWDAVRFYNKAYNMGLMDPESFTQTFDDYMLKAKNGQYIQIAVAGFSSSTNEALASIDSSMGFEPIPTGSNVVSNLYTPDAPYGWGSSFAMAITANCENPEKAMAVLNYLNGAEGSRLLKSGVEGIHWEMQDGKPVYTEEYLTNVAEDPNYKTNEGIGAYTVFVGIAGEQKVDGYTVDLSKSEDAMVENKLQVDEDFCEYYESVYGVEFDYPGKVIEYMVQEGEMETNLESLVVPSLMGSMSTDTNMIMTQISTTLAVEIPQLIILPEDELENGIKDTIEKIDAMGYTEAAAEIQGLMDAATEAAAALE
jgi:hypothetical protein